MHLESKSINFWKKKSSKLIWGKKPKKIITENKGFFEWFSDGKINIYENCILNQIKNNNGEKIALITINIEKKIKKYSYLELDKIINSFCEIIKQNINLKGKKEKRVMVHSSASIESASLMLACSKLGVHFSVIFEELKDDAIKSRIDIFNPDLLFTRLDKKKFLRNYKKTFKILNKKILFNENINRNKIFKKDHKITFYKSTKNFFTLFTSGSTGVPKGITHSYGGFMVYANYTCRNQFGMNKNSIVLTASDAGWINGHTYSLFGPLSVGSTTLLLQSPLLILDLNLLKKIINEIKIDIIYLPVTLIRLMKSIFKNQKIIRNNLKTLGSMGEPLAPSIGNWYANFFGKAKNSIVNTYFQTETGGIICSPIFNSSNKKNPHGSVGNVCTKHIKLNKLNNNNKIEIKIKSPWPGCMKNVINGKKEWDKYWDNKKNFRMFDLASKIKNNIYIHGRIDDVINVRGHRIGSEEIESTVLKIKDISECCAVSIEDRLEGNSIYLFVVSLKRNKKEIEDIINSNFGSFALPKSIYFVNELPKTRSGKILRRLVRSILINPNKKDYGDLTTILNPLVVNSLKNVILSKNE